jgi:hypothetical protein
MVGMAAGLGGLFVATAVLLTLVFTGALDGLEGPAAVVLSPPVFLTVPAVLCAVVFGTLSARRRAARDTHPD